MSMATQEVWPPGELVPVTVEISRGEASGFARYYHDLPGGFFVENSESSGADFFWDNNQVNYVWTDLPEREKILIRYYVKADELLAGSFRITGRFDYIIDGKRRVSVYSGTISVKLERGADVLEVDDIPVMEMTNPLMQVSDTPPATHDAISTEPVPPVTEKVDFRVQVSISSARLSREELENRIGCRLKHGIIVLEAGTMFKYQSGSFSHYDEASEYLSELKECGVKDAFVVAFRGGMTIPVDEARRLTGR